MYPPFQKIYLGNTGVIIAGSVSSLLTKRQNLKDRPDKNSLNLLFKISSIDFLNEQLISINLISNRGTFAHD